MSKTITKKTDLWNMKDKMNLTSAFTLEELCASGDLVVIDKAALLEVENEDGTIQKSFALHTIDGRYYVGISATAYDQVEDIIDYLIDLQNDLGQEVANEEDLVGVKAVKRKSKAGRDYIVLEIV